jgi:Cohesin domain/PEP-CTERM motif
MRARLFAVTVILCLFASPLLGGTISILPATSPVTVGQVFTLSVDISGATDLYGYQFDLGFNPAILTATSVTEGPFLATGGATIFVPGTIDNVGGSIASNADILNGPLSGVNGSGDLLDVTFQALATGSGSVTIFNVFALSSLGQGLTETTANATVNVAAGSVSPVPEPSTGLMLATGTLGLFALLRLRSSQSALS